jgi:hypothetical protein
MRGAGMGRQNLHVLCFFASVSLLTGQIKVGPFAAEVRTVHSIANALSVAVDGNGSVWAATGSGLMQWRDGKWNSQGVEASLVAAAGGKVWFASKSGLWEGSRRVADLPAGARQISVGTAVFISADAGLFRFNGDRLVREVGAPSDVRQAAVARDGRVAVAAASGLYLQRAGAWERVLPKSGNRSWAPDDVRGVVFDSKDRLWFVSPQGAGCLDGGTWSLYTGADGLPYDDFTTVVAGEDGVVWFGTRIGAIRFDGKTWEYRQGLRWLPDDSVRSIAVGPAGDAWIATSKGISQIERRVTTLAEKARFFESEIDKRHRRTEHGFVLDVQLKRAGDTSEWTQHDSDNDGLWTSMYGAGECFAAGATGSEDARRRAKAAFEALRFLGTVTQGGPHPAPKGFVARSVLPVSGPDPNRLDSVEHDKVMRETRDRSWKSLNPRWPLSADGKWYWKADTSSDELDGHYFFYGVYYDLVARSEEEKRAVREQVAGLTDHLMDHNFQLVDHDGKPTRWGIFDPANLNHNVDFWAERGMNSLSLLSYLKVAGHITGDAKYERAYRKLIDEHAYEENVLIPKTNAGPGAGNQSDDEMIFMNYYGLLRYEKDPALRRKYLWAFYNHWKMEATEMNPLFAFLYAVTARGETYSDAFEKVDLAAGGGWLEDSLDTLRRFPTDRIAWGYLNSQRKDLVRLPEYARGAEGSALGYRVNSQVLPIDERYVGYWNHDPWRLDQAGDGRTLGDGAAYLLPYYLGVYAGFLQE